MAAWTLAGSFGYVGGPLLLAAALRLGLGWRSVTIALGVAAAPLALVLRRRLPEGPRDAAGLRPLLRETLLALRRRDVLRWLAVLEAADLMLDVLHGFLALYLVEVAGLRPVDAGLGVAVWTGAGLAGDALLVLVLGRSAGLSMIRATAAASLVLYPAFLLLPGLAAKLTALGALGLLNAGWYAIPKAELYAALPGRSGIAVAAGGLGSIAGTAATLLLGVLRGRFGLAPTMWVLAAAPVALLALVPRRR